MQRSKVVKLIGLDNFLDDDSETEYLVIAHKGIDRTKYTTSKGDVVDAFNFVYRKDNVDLSEYHCVILPFEHEQFYLADTKKWYDVNKLKEFEQLRNDLEAACALALLDG